MKETQYNICLNSKYYNQLRIISTIYDTLYVINIYKFNVII